MNFKVMGLRARVQRNPACNAVDVYLLKESMDGVSAYVCDMVMATVEPGSCPHIDPAFSLQVREAQSLMDELWVAGFRSTEGTGSAGALKQAEDHIKSLKSVLDRVLAK